MEWMNTKVHTAALIIRKQIHLPTSRAVKEEKKRERIILRPLGKY